MTNSEYQDKMNSIVEKIGQDASSLIMDDIAVLLTDNKNMNQQIDNEKEENKKLKARNESLMNVNANLLQQIPMGNEEDIKPNSEEKKKEPFDYRTAFDEKRKF